MDLHGDKMTVDVLRSAVIQINKEYLPININHDIRRPPSGRVVSAQVVELPDGEFALEGILEVFDETDTLESLKGDGRKIPVNNKDIEKFVVEYDRSFRTAEGQEFVKELECLSQQKSVFKIKKAVDPVSVLIIAGGAFIVGSIAQGFFKNIGEDIYAKLKSKLSEYYSKKLRADQILDFNFTVKKQNGLFEVNMFLDNPTREDIEIFLDSGLKQLDTVLKNIPESALQDIANITVEFSKQKLLVKYAVREDAVPVTLKEKQYIV